MKFFQQKPFITQLLTFSVFLGSSVLFLLLTLTAWYTIDLPTQPLYPDTIRYHALISGLTWGLSVSFILRHLLLSKPLHLYSKIYYGAMMIVGVYFITQICLLCLLFSGDLRAILQPNGHTLSDFNLYYSIVTLIVVSMIILGQQYWPAKKTKTTAFKLQSKNKHHMIRFIKRVLIWDFLTGLRQTAKTMFQKKKTIQFPEEKIPLSPRFRGLLALRRYPNGEERCIACKLCEAVCPALAITIEAKVRSDGSRRTTRFDIDMFKCINCGFCEESCPVDSIVVTSEHHYVIRERGENILTKDKLLAIGDVCEPKLAQDRANDQPYR